MSDIASEVVLGSFWLMLPVFLFLHCFVEKRINQSRAFNLPKYHEWSIVTNYVDCLTICGCISLIDKPTSFRKNCMPSLLDHTYTNICDVQRINDAGMTF